MTNTIESIKKSKGVRSLVFVLFFLSGISGLIYEIIWTRKLSYIFGGTIYAISTVLTSYMAGLALGSYIFGRYIDKKDKPLNVYASLQIGIGVFGIIIPIILNSFIPIFSLIYNSFHTSFFSFSLIRFAFIFLILIIPTSFMGGTVPVISKFLIKSKETSGFDLGLLYAVNTFGAVLGTFLSGFILIVFWGIWWTILFAACINFCVAAISFFLNKQINVRTPSLTLPLKGGGEGGG